MSLRSRLAKAERLASDNGEGHCSACPPLTILNYRQEGPDAEAILLPGQARPGPCKRCGRAAEVMEIVEVSYSARADAEHFRDV
jgi:hypothetical protein